MNAASEQARPTPLPRTVAEIAGFLGGQVVGDGSVRLTGFSAATTAKAGDLTFAENEGFFAKAEQSAAAAILASGKHSSAAKPVIQVANARAAFARVLPLFFPETRPAPGIHPTSVIASDAEIDASAHVGPHCVLGAKVRLGPRATLFGGNHVGDHSSVGDDSCLFPNAVLYPQTTVGCRVRIHAGAIIGSDGFGYVFDAGAHLKVPQIGSVILEDDVEIGANTTIDRGALGPTVIGRGTKIDNLVQIAHNVATGQHCIIISQTGIAGSTKLGSYTTIAGKVGIAGHLKIGSRVIVAAGSGIMHDIPDGEKWMGFIAQPDRQSKREILALRKLPDLLKRVRELEAQIAALRSG